MKVTKILALLLSLVLFCALVGCEKIDLSGGKDTDSDDASSGNGATAGGTVLTVKTTLTGDETFRPAGGSSSEADRILAKIAAAEQATGYTVQVEIVSKDTLDSDFVRVSRSGGKYADIIQTDAMFISRYFDKGYFISLEEAGLTPSQTGTLKSVDGIAYGLRADGWNHPLPTASFLMFYNEKIFTDSGVESPMEIYEDGAWNWVNLESLCDLLGKNTTSEICSVSVPTQEEPDLIWATLHAAGALYFDKDGVCVMDSQNALNGFSALRKFLNTGNTYTVGSYINGTADPTAKLAFANGRTAFYVGNASAYFDSASDSLPSALGEDLRLLGFPAMKSGVSGAVFTQEDTFIGVTAWADKELCQKILPVMFAPEEGEDPAKDLIDSYFLNEADGEIYLDLLKNADTHSALGMTDNLPLVEEMFVRVVQGGSAKEILNNLQTIFNSSAKG